MTNSLSEVAKSDVVFVIGSYTTWCHPVFGYLLKQAVRNRGVKLIVCDPRRIDLVEFADTLADAARALVRAHPHGEANPEWKDLSSSVLGLGDAPRRPWREIPRPKASG